MAMRPAALGSFSKDQQKLYREWFDLADADGDGRITGADATRFFATSNLCRDELKKVWALADSERQGSLGFKEFVVAMQLISLAQRGIDLTLESLKAAAGNLKNIDPPVLDGLVMLQRSRMSPASPIQVNTPGDFVYIWIIIVPPISQNQPLLNWFAPKTAKKALEYNETSISDGLKRLYLEKLKPLEVAYHFDDFVSPFLTDSDFDAKPMVMLLGHYSTGKTTFIRHLLRCDYPGSHIGLEPTTDKFYVVMSGPDERSIPGYTLAVRSDLPYGGLERFGESFLAKLECSQMPHPLLDQITFVDTPGFLHGEKQQANYDLHGVISWFTAKCDLIILLFDPHKLDISDEFKRVISSLRGSGDKIRVVLNKADQVDTQQLMRVYGALMWTLALVFNTPEVLRVFIGSFKDRPLSKEIIGSFPLGHDLFDKEQDDLLKDLINIPKKASDHRINGFVKRARAAKTHAYIISHLRKEMPALMGKSRAQERLIDNLEEEFAKIQKDYHLQPCNFPDVDHFREVLDEYKIDQFEKLKPKLIKAVDDMLNNDIPELLKRFGNPYD